MAVALRDIREGETVGEILIREDIPRGHKFALSFIEKDRNVIKYGNPIGHAKCDIRIGEHVHIHNLATNLGDDENYVYEPKMQKRAMTAETAGLQTGEDVAEAAEIQGGEGVTETAEMQGVGGVTETAGMQVGEDVAETSELPRRNSFLGYLRSDGRAGVRNELWIVPTVGCVNSVAKAIGDRCGKLVEGNIDAVVAYNHPYGCSQMGDDQENTREALAALIKHPNAGGVLVVGLGCENSNIGVLKGYLGDISDYNIEFINCQDETDEVEKGVMLMERLAEKALKCTRTPQPFEKLTVGLKCGGSDGLSGITANPTVGVFSDILTEMGGSTILTEVPEMFGAERLLMNRACSREIFDKTVNLIKDFKDYYRKNNQTIYENPSPGNKAGGISTLEDKALGCTQKSGSGPVIDVLAYAEPLRKNGLNLLSAPGNDMVAATALALSGAQLILFTTGRGTPFSTVVPTVKISTNSSLAEKKNHWIDFDCGILLNDGESVDRLGEKLFEYVVKVASGEKVKSEENGFRDLAIFKTGVTL